MGILMKAERIECPVYYTMQRGNHIVKVALPKRYEKWVRCKAFVDPTMMSLTLVGDDEGNINVLKADCYNRPVVLITKPLQHLFIDTSKMAKVTLYAICYDDRVEFVLQDLDMLKETKFGYEVLR